MLGRGAGASLARWGVQDRYHDAGGRERQVSQSTVEALLDAMDARTESPPEPDHPILFVRHGGDLPSLGPGTLTFEDGGEVETGAPAAGGPASGIPFGYHHWSAAVGGREATVVVSPGVCGVPETPAWGWAAQLYALRSEQSWGIGDLADLRLLATWSREALGAGVLLVSPLHASGPALPQNPSPYFPSSRRFRNPLYLRVEEVPGAELVAELVGPLAAAGRALNTHRLIERDKVFRLKMQALSALWEASGNAGDDPAFRRYREEQGTALQEWSCYCVLAERHGNNWRLWPGEFRRPGGSAVAAARAGAPRRALFHEWLQWQLDRQLAAASSELAVVHDLAVGFDPDGADAWSWQDCLAPGMSVGAPPDEFNTLGQDWGLPPFDPWRLRADGYRPFVETVRSAFRHAGGLRIDHVMGLFRQFWVPHGSSPAEGAYVRYPADDLLDILAVEAHRAGAFVIGEDLGTVEDRVRSELESRHILSYRLLWFEERPTAEWPLEALAAVNTHDLPTVAGLWTGSDLEAQRRAGVEPNEESMGALRQRLGTVTGVDAGAPSEAAIVGAYGALGRAPSLLVTAALDDAMAVEERPNMPGTTGQWPNWCLALPLSLEEIRRHPLALAVAGALRR